MTKKTTTIEAPLVGRIRKLRRALWTAHVPVVGAYTQGRSVLDAARMLERVIEMMLRLDGHKVTVMVTVLGPAVDGAAVVAVTCDRRGLLAARAEEFARLSAGVTGPIRNPFFVAVQRDGITIDVEPKLPTEPTSEQRLEHMREQLALVMDAARRAGRMRRDAMIYRLGVLGVAAAATTEAFRAKHPDIPWDAAIAMRELLGKPDRLLDHAALRKAVRETVPALMRALRRPDLEVAEVIRLNLTPAEAKALRDWGAKNLLAKPKQRERSTRQAPARQGAFASEAAFRRAFAVVLRRYGKTFQALADHDREQVRGPQARRRQRARAIAGGGGGHARDQRQAAKRPSARRRRDRAREVRDT